MQPEKLIIFDTTLRDGEQCPGASLNIKEKLEIARQLALLKVDVIEAGFPVASPGDFESVKQIAEEIRGSKIAGLSRALEKDIEATTRALENAESPRIHIFLSTSKVHRDHMVEKAKGEIIEMGVKAIQFARKYFDDVEFSPMDATRTEKDFLVDVTREVISAGATTVNIPDTVGYTVPEEFAELIRHLKSNVSNIDQAVISVHCHNDLGLAVANSIAAVQAGARQIECTINGIGERAGNAAMEEVVMAVRTRKDFFNSVYTGIETKHIQPCSKLVSSLTGFFVQRNKAIVGKNAFAHEAGIHQDGVLKQRDTYEIMEASEVGIPSNYIVLGKHSGRHAFKDRLTEFGYKLDDEKFEIAFIKFKELCDKKKYVFDEDIEALINEEFVRSGDYYKLVSLSCSSGTEDDPSAELTLLADEESITISESGDGPIDSVFRAICKAVGVDPKLDSYNVASVTGGMDAQAEVSVIIKDADFTARGKGASTDVIVASAKAFINALNNLRWRKLHPKIASPKGI